MKKLLKNGTEDSSIRPVIDNQAPENENVRKQGQPDANQLQQAYRRRYLGQHGSMNRNQIPSIYSRMPVQSYEGR